MPNDLPERKSLRLPNYDYSQAGCYFITICTQDKKHYFGEIVGATPCGRPEDATLCGCPNDPNIMVESWLMKTKDKFHGVDIPEYVIMPNHVHFIVEIMGDHGTGDHMGSPLRGMDDPCVKSGVREHDAGDHMGSPLRGMDGLCGKNGMREHDAGDHTGSSLRDIVGWFKTMTTNDYIRGVKEGLYMPFDKRLWQRNYYEHIIRDEQDYIQIAEYIRNNPAKWEIDSMNKEVFHA